MAVLKGNVLGDLSGKLGKIAARIIRGRTILAQRPASFNVNYSPTMVEIRRKFAVTANFVKNLVTLAALYQIWMKKKIGAMSVFNYIFSQNFDASSADKPTVDNIITPPDGFALPVQTATVTADAVNIQLNALNTAAVIDGTVETQYVANGLLCYYNPTDTADAPFAIVPIKSNPDVMDAVNPITVNIALNVVQKAVAAKYQNSILFAALATLNEDGDAVQYSSTYSKNN